MTRRFSRGTPNIRVVLGVAFCAYVLAGLASLAEFPLVWLDEPWYTQSAWRFATEGDFALPMFVDLAGFDRDNVVYGRSYLAAVASVYEVAGVSPFTARIVSFVSGLIAIVAVYGVGRELWDRRVGVVAAVFLAVAPNVVLQSHDARPEMMLVAAWTTAFYLLLVGDRLGSTGRLFVAGLVATLAADVHLNGAVFAPALALVLIARRASWRALATFALGAAAGIVWWLAAHVLGDPQLFLDQLRAYDRGLPITRLLADPILVFGAESFRYLFVQPIGSVVLFLLGIVAAMVLIIVRPDRSLATLLILTGCVFVFLALFAGPKTPIYAILLWPVAALLVARHVDIAPRPLAWATAGLVFVASVGSLGWSMAQQWPSDYDRYVAKLREVVPADARLQAPATVWFGFIDHPFVATQYFLWVGPYEEEVRRLGIDYVIAGDLDPLDGCTACRTAFPDEMRSFLQEHAELVAEIEDPYYGRVPDDDGTGYVSRVYKVLD